MDHPGGPYDIFCCKYPNIKAHKIALGGQTSEWVLDQLKQYEGEYTDLVIVVGTNDVYGFWNILDSYKNIQSIVEIAHLKKANVILYTVPPTGNYFYYDSAIADKTRKLNTFIKSLPKVSVVDDYTLLNYNEGMLPVFTLQEDWDTGIHLSPYAHQYCFPILEQYLF